jgi:hypothetical protein
MCCKPLRAAVRARESGYHKMADELLEIADDASNDFMERKGKDGEAVMVVDHDHIARSRLRVDTRKWLLSKALPKVYGDKLELAGSMTMKHEDVLDRLAKMQEEGGGTCSANCSWVLPSVFATLRSTQW